MDCFAFWSSASRFAAACAWILTRLGIDENRWTVCDFDGKVLQNLGFRGVRSMIHAACAWNSLVRALPPATPRHLPRPPCGLMDGLF